MDLLSIPGLDSLGLLRLPESSLRRLNDAPKFCAYLPTWPTVLAERSAAPVEKLPILRMRVCVESENVIGFGLGLTFLVNPSAPLVKTLDK